ncbi:uncharacterized protein LOC126824151 [Patella vulgata]|uniref:uncharacterized protein LOC126824151 n=1 Tax=Patella vulgata TaxID=6465 RepID=UPI0021802391|nr:uncharacterized protein LOC126824151 [Patella vulgata]XP_055957989.1 uncharacterized protein LOC126824151 [Patella vulgata]
MLLFGIFEGERVTLDVSPGMTVAEFKKILQEKLNISDDLCKFDKTVISLTYARAELRDTWVLSDLGIVHGTTIRIQLKEEENPVLYIQCSHTNETLTIFDNLNVGSMPVKDLRSLVSKRTGLPVGIFRLCTSNGTEMFDCHLLEYYGIEAGSKLHLENWDGLNEFINLASRGFTPQVISQISLDDIHGRYLLKVALYIAAHFGNVDLARSLLKLGGRSDEPIKDPPQRQWCGSLTHIDSLKAPVHVATEMGNLGVLRLFVNHDITCLMAKDGRGLMPMNIALRQHIKNCAPYLLTKQWTKINLTKNVAVSVKTYDGIKRWWERAKETAYIKYGLSKSSIKKRNIDFGPLVSYGVLVDGFSKSSMNGKPKVQLVKEEKDKRKAKENVIPTIDENEEDPEMYFKNININLPLTDRSTIFADRKNVQNIPKSDRPKHYSPTTQTKQAWKAKPDGRGTPGRSSRSTTPDASKKDSESSPERDHGFKLPPILERSRRRLVSQSQPALNLSPKGSIKLGKGGGSRLTKNNKNAFLRTSKPNKTLTQSLPNVNVLPPDKPASMPALSIASTDRSEMGKSLTDTPGASMSSITEEAQSSDDLPNISKARKKRRGKIPSSVLLSKAQASDSTIPLPLINNESNSRPFFYLNGLREDDVIEPTVDLLTKYKGGSPRERAIRSLVVASNFKEKPWLTQVRMALSLSTTSMKRDVKRIKSSTKDVSVQCALKPTHPVSSIV